MILKSKIYDGIIPWYVCVCNLFCHNRGDMKVTEYILQVKKNGVWTNWGYKTKSLFEIKQKIEYCKKALGSKVKLRYVTQIIDDPYQIPSKGRMLF